MKKIKLLIIVSVIIVSLLAIRWYIEKNNKTVIYKGLSNRGKEYIKKQSKQGGSQWSSINTDSQKPAGPQSYTVGNCATVIIPYPVLFEKDKNDCFRSFTINRPKGKIVVNFIVVSTQNVDDTPDVKSRKLSKNFIESEKQVNGKTYMILTNSTKGTYEKYAFTIIKDRMLVFVFIFNTTENMDKTFFETLSSVTFIEKT